MGVCINKTYVTHSLSFFLFPLCFPSPTGPFHQLSVITCQSTNRRGVRAKGKVNASGLVHLEAIRRPWKEKNKLYFTGNIWPQAAPTSLNLTNIPFFPTCSHTPLLLKTKPCHISHTAAYLPRHTGDQTSTFRSEFGLWSSEGQGRIATHSTSLLPTDIPGLEDKPKVCF